MAATVPSEIDRCVTLGRKALAVALSGDRASPNGRSVSSDSMNHRMGERFPGQPNRIDFRRVTIVLLFETDNY